MILKTPDDLQSICNGFLYNVQSVGFDIEDEIKEIYKFLKLFNSSEIEDIEETLSTGVRGDIYIFLEKFYKKGIDITKMDICPFMTMEFISKVYDIFPYMNQLPYRVDPYVANPEIKSNSVQSVLYDLCNTSYRQKHKSPNIYVWSTISYLDKESLVHISNTNLECTVIDTGKATYHPYFKIKFKTKKSKIYEGGVRVDTDMMFVSTGYSYNKAYTEKITVDLDKSGSIYESVAKKIAYNIFRAHVINRITMKNFISSDAYILSELSDIVFDINPITDKKINTVKGW